MGKAAQGLTEADSDPMSQATSEGNSAWSPSAHPFLDEAFLGPYFDIVAPRRGERRVDVSTPEGNAVLAVRGGGLRPVLTLPGEGFADYMDLRYPDSEQGRALLKAVFDRAQGGPIVLRNLRGTSPTSQLAVQAARERGWLIFVQEQDVAPYIDLQGSWDTFHKERRDRKSRYNLRRAARRLDSMGGLEFTHHTEPEDIDTHLEEAFDLYARRPRGADSIWRFNGELGRSFYREMAMAFARKGSMDLAFLRVNGAAVAFAYSLCYGGTYYYNKVGITDDPQVGQFSPGRLLLEHLMERAFSAGLRRFDFMVGTESYKDAWSTGHDTIKTVVLAPREPLAAASWMIVVARLRLRQRVRESSALLPLAQRLRRTISRTRPSTVDRMD